MMNIPFEMPLFQNPALIYSSSGEKVLLEERATVFTKTVPNGKGEIHIATIYKRGTREILFCGSGLNLMDAIYRCIVKKVDSKKQIVFPKWDKVNHIRVIK